MMCLELCLAGNLFITANVSLPKGDRYKTYSLAAIRQAHCCTAKFEGHKVLTGMWLLFLFSFSTSLSLSGWRSGKRT